MGVEVVGEVFEDIGGQVPIFLLLLSLEVILSLLSKNMLTRFLSSFCLRRLRFLRQGLGFPSLRSEDSCGCVS